MIFVGRHTVLSSKLIKVKKNNLILALNRNAKSQ
jgi:hypothetical protein